MIFARISAKAMSLGQKRALKKAVKASALARKTAAVNTKRLSSSVKVNANLQKVLARRNSAFSKITSQKIASKQSALAKEAASANLLDASTKRYFLKGAKKRAAALKKFEDLSKQAMLQPNTSVKEVLKLATLDNEVEKLTKFYAKLAIPMTTRQVGRRQLANKAAGVVATGAVAYTGLTYAKTKFTKPKKA